MLLYLMRHAAAESTTLGGDANRPLSPTGREQLQRLIPLLLALGLRPEWIVASPYRRAMETAQLLAAGIGYSGEILSDTSLLPTSTPTAAQSLVLAFAQASQLLLIGHAPNVVTWVTQLCATATLRIAFPSGAICCVELENPRSWTGRLCWHLIPPPGQTSSGAAGSGAVLP